jgi:uncharacterized membrane protein YbhN (UPF0104 family)
VFFAVAVALLVWSVLARREELGEALTRLDAGTVLVSLVLACAGLVAQLLSWRSLLAATGDVPPLRASARIYYHGQLGKYVPGSVWAVVAQAELGKAHRLSRARSAVVALGALAVLLVVGGTVAAVGLAAASPGSLSTYWWAVAVVPVGVIGLLPPVFNRLVALALRLLRRGEDPVRVAGPGLARSAGWALAMWLLFGLHAAVLVHDLDPVSPGRSLVLSTGAFALAWVVGFLIAVAPAGTGPREAALVLALSPVLPPADALLVALVSRVLMVAADAAAAGVAALLARRVSPAGPGTAAS